MGRPRCDDLEFVKQAATIWDDDEGGVGELGYHPRLFCQLALPYKDPGELPFWERRNGDFTLAVRPAIETAADGRRRVGYPFGSIPRLLLSWLATEVVQTRSAELVLGQSLSDFMRQIGMTATGGQTGTITRLRKQINRLFDASISAEYHGDAHRDVGRNFNIASAKDLWWTNSDRNADQRSLLPSTVRLSDEFFQELIEHPVPVSLDALRLLQSSPLRLDIYAWLTHRLSYLRKRTNVTWGQLQSQFGSVTDPNTWRGRAKFRESFARQLPYVLAVYPTARAEIAHEGVVLLPSPPHVSRRALGPIAGK